MPHLTSIPAARSRCTCNQQAAGQPIAIGWAA